MKHSETKPEGEAQILPKMVVLDTEPNEEERMTKKSLQFVLDEAEEHNVGLFYLSPNTEDKRDWFYQKSIEKINKMGFM